MNQDDRYKTTSWDGGEVARQAGGQTGAGEDQPSRSAGEERSRPAGNGRKRGRRFFRWAGTAARHRIRKRGFRG